MVLSITLPRLCLLSYLEGNGAPPILRGIIAIISHRREWKNIASCTQIDYDIYRTNSRQETTLTVTYEENGMNILIDYHHTVIMINAFTFLLTQKTL